MPASYSCGRASCLSRSRLVSTIALPGHDFWLFDGELVVFVLFEGSGVVADQVMTTDQDVIDLCRSAFEAVWQLAIPNGDYHPR